jgi:hypothetical protein
MEEDSTTRSRTADELRALGASEDFITAYFTEYDGRHSIVIEIDLGFGGSLIDSDERPFRPSVGGGYFKRLWEHGADEAWNYADGDNRRILEKASLAPMKA